MEICYEAKIGKSSSWKHTETDHYNRSFVLLGQLKDAVRMDRHGQLITIRDSHIRRS